MGRFKFIIVDLEGSLAKLIMERGIGVYLLYDKETQKFILIPAWGLHVRKGFRCEKET
jgi:hypothetical protein